MTKKSVVAVDLGFGWTKAVKSNGSQWSQPSVVGLSRPLFDGQARRGDVVFTGNGEEYFVGNLAVRQSDIKYHSINGKKADMLSTEILLKSSLGVLAPKEQVNVVTGLPVDYYFSQKESLGQLLRNVSNSNFYQLNLVEEREYMTRTAINDFKIVPQPFGAAMDYLLNHDGSIARVEDAKKRILVIDIGFYTLDLLVLNSLEIDKASCSRDTLGVSVAYRLLQRFLHETIGKAPDIHELDQYVITGEYEGRNIKPLIVQAFRALANQIQSEVESLNMSFHKFIIAGGASNLVADHFTLPGIEVLHDPQLANVRGYLKIGAKAWKE